MNSFFQGFTLSVTTSPEDIKYDQILKDQLEVIGSFVNGNFDELTENDFKEALRLIAISLIWSDRNEYSDAETVDDNETLKSTVFEVFFELGGNALILACMDEAVIGKKTFILCRIISYYLMIFDNVKSPKCFVLLCSNGFISNLLSHEYLRKCLINEGRHRHELKTYFFMFCKSCLVRMLGCDGQSEDNVYMHLFTKSSRDGKYLISCDLADAILHVLAMHPNGIASVSRNANTEPDVFIRNLERSLLLMFLDVKEVRFREMYRQRYLEPWLRVLIGRDMLLELRSYLEAPISRSFTRNSYHESLLFLKEDLVERLYSSNQSLSLFQNLLCHHMSISVISALSECSHDNEISSKVFFEIAGLWKNVFLEDNCCNTLPEVGLVLESLGKALCRSSLPAMDFVHGMRSSLRRCLKEDVNGFISFMQNVYSWKGEPGEDPENIALFLYWIENGVLEIPVRLWESLLNLCKGEQSHILNIFQIINRDYQATTEICNSILQGFSCYADVSVAEQSLRSFESLPVLYPLERIQLCLCIDKVLQTHPPYKPLNSFPNNEFGIIAWLRQE